MAEWTSSGRPDIAALAAAHNSRGEMRTVRLGKPWRLSESDLVALRYSAVSEKSLFIQGILLTRISLLKLVTRPIVHVLDEWAKSAPDTNGSAFGSDWLSQTDRICLILVPA